MKKLLIAGTMLMSAPFVSLAQTSTTGTQATGTVTITTTITDPGLVPGDFFYFLDRWSEALNTAFTFNKEKKAKLHLEYAKERVAEMKDVLKNPNAKLEDVKSAKDNFDVQIADAAAIVKNEKEAGKDVAGLARELDDELDASKTELKDILKGHSNESSRAEAGIRAKLEALSPTDPQVQGLTQALESITKEKGDSMKEEGDLDASLADEQALFEEVMGKEMSAQKHMEQALRLRDRMEQGLAAPEERLMRDAEAAMKSGDFEKAMNMSKEAEHALEKAREESGTLLNMGIPSTGERNGTMDVDNQAAGDLTNLESNIKDSEKMMDGGIEVKSVNEINNR